MKRKMEETKDCRAAVEKEYNDRMAAVRNGTNPELQRIRDGLSRAKQRRIAMADKQRKLQIRNINELYEYVSTPPITHVGLLFPIYVTINLFLYPCFVHFDVLYACICTYLFPCRICRAAGMRCCR